MLIKNTKYRKDQVNKMIETYINSPVVKSFLAGSLSGTCSTIIFQPLDLVKTRIQNATVSGPRNTGLLAVAVNVVRNEKVLGLWKGMAPSLSRTVPGIGVYFSSLHWLRSNMGSVDPSAMESVCMGAFARSISGLSMLPFTVIKTRFESGCFEYQGVKQALVTIYRVEGAKGLYSGLSATLLRDAPFSGLYLMFYTQTKKYVKSYEMFNMQLPLVHFGCGLVAGGFASVVTQPPDVIKTKMQLYPERFSTVRSVIHYVYQKDGMKGFLRGVVPRTLRRTMMAAMAWTVYEQVMQSLGIK